MEGTSGAVDSVRLRGQAGKTTLVEARPEATSSGNPGSVSRETTRRGGSGSRQPSPGCATRGAQAREVGVKSPRASDRSRRGQTSQTGKNGPDLSKPGWATADLVFQVRVCAYSLRAAGDRRAHALTGMGTHWVGGRLGDLAGCARGSSRLQKPSGSARFPVSRGEEPREAHRRSSSPGSLRGPTRLGYARANGCCVAQNGREVRGANADRSFGACQRPKGEGAPGQAKAHVDAWVAVGPRRAVPRAVNSV